MSGYPYSSSEQPNYAYNASASSYSSTAVPQYTQAQIDQYYQQYQQYPPQPYQVIQYDYGYSRPAATGYQQPHVAVQGTYGQGANTTSGYYASPVNQGGTGSGSTDTSRSNSRGRTWTCDLPNCTSTANFTRLADLQRHQSTVHGMGLPEFPCTVARCTRVGDKGFTRRDHLVEHLRNFHHLDIPKRKAGERSANPSGAPYYPS
ncbi:uncharacterized protein BDR25DRAFT_103320 [Lindgomyces ingoldianus]|uniref:Uncharacterized protein n=1 Tax=Lindgomyces ingoldianus TaxID=673940 RepID=A0ACB6R8V5_9PLEO|nr:uncharacterized protein BDR25DRAFT_103320 [Lindgomyces ingoldianus]KAF2475517.1 hypothetical protein BDR25DRAFT_103320 [Lindgomyces ingoldianus]